MNRFTFSQMFHVIFLFLFGAIANAEMQMSCTGIDGTKTLNINLATTFLLPAGLDRGEGNNSFVCQNTRDRRPIRRNRLPGLRSLFGTTNVNGVNYKTAEFIGNLSMLLYNRSGFFAADTQPILNNPRVSVWNGLNNELSTFNNANLADADTKSQVKTRIENYINTFKSSCFQLAIRRTPEPGATPCPYAAILETVNQYGFDFAEVIDDFSKYLQLAQDETAGHGLCGLTFVEYMAVKRYSSHGHTLIQTAPSQLNSDGQILRNYFIQQLESGLLKIGKPSQIENIFRGGLINRIAGSNEIEMGVTSSSAHVDVAVSFMERNPESILLKVSNPSTGSYIEDITSFSGEYEILFGRVKIKVDEEWNCKMRDSEGEFNFTYLEARQCPNEDCRSLPNSRTPASATIKKKIKKKKM